MSELILKNPYFTLSGADLSDYVRQITLNLKKDQVENTASNAAGVKTYLIGLEDDDIPVVLNQNFASGTVDTVLFSCWNAGVNVSAVIKPVTGSTTVNNPQYAINVLVPEYPPLNGSVGGNAEVSITLKGNGAVARTTA